MNGDRPMTASTYLNREESFMYDREPAFKLVPTLNAARIEYTEKGVLHMASRRCDVLQISRSTAVLSLLTRYRLPQECYLDIPDARIRKVGCKVMKVSQDDTMVVRFLRLLDDRELNRIFVYSTHPSHRNVRLDVRNW